MITQQQLADRRMMIQAVAERMRSRKAQMARIKKASQRTSSVARKVKPKKDLTEAPPCGRDLQRDWR